MRTVLADNKGGIILGTKFINKYGKRFTVVSNPKICYFDSYKKDFKYLF